LRRREMERKRLIAEERRAFASQRASEPLVVLRMRILGEPEDIARIAGALPIPTKPGETFLKEYGVSGEPLPLPSSAGLKRSLRKPVILLSFFLPFLLLSRAMEVFPFSLRVPETTGLIPWLLPPFFIALAVWAKWRVWRPIVCSVRELATLFSFPLHLERYPLEFAEAPLEEVMVPETEA